MEDEYDFSNAIRGSVLLRRAYERALREAFRKSRPHFACSQTTFLSWPKDGRLDYYGFVVGNISQDGSIVEVNWIFKKDEKYCCEESGCHTVLTYNQGSKNKKTAKMLADRWALIRSFLPENKNIPRITLKVAHILEVGCQLNDPWAEAVTTTRTHQYIWEEPSHDGLPIA